MKTPRRLILSALLAAACLALLCTPAAAYTRVDTSAQTSLTLVYRDAGRQDRPLAGMALRLYLVAELDETARFHTTAAFAPAQVDLSGSDWSAAAATLAAYARRNADSVRPAAEGVTDSEGRLSAQLPVGLYLVAGDRLADGGYSYTPTTYLLTLPLLDRDLIASHPKWFGGYSDVTALHTFFQQNCQMETYHVTMPSTEPKPDDFTMNWLKKALFGTLTGPVEFPGKLPEILVPGKAEGILCGGNLSLVAASLGTPWELDTKGKVLFLEDIGEKTYRVDAMLTQLRNAGKFRDCAGVILGAWTDCEPEYAEKTLTLAEIFRQLILPAGKPCICDVACGHVLPTLSLPMGRKITLDADSKQVILGGM